MFFLDRITVLVSPKSLFPPCSPDAPLAGPAARVPGLPPPGLGGLGGLGEFKLMLTFPI